LYEFKERGRAFPVEYVTSLSDFFKGLRRKDANEKQEGTRKAKEGKDDIPFAVYEWLCRYFIMDGDVFSWSYLVLCWNVMCRTNNVAGMKITHLAIVADALGVYLPKTKADQGIFAINLYFLRLYYNIIINNN